jgi:hypothetical protein
MEIFMRSLRKRVEVVCFGLYLAAIFLGTSMEAIGQIFH